MKRCATGVPGLDEVLQGGLIAGCVYLIDGHPGAGKTTLALQYLLQGREQGERGVYVTLSETADELRAGGPCGGERGGPGDAEAFDAGPSGQRRILVVDDNVDAADSLGALLGLAGHEVRVDYNGHDALSTAATFLPHAVFCDIGMPGMDGLELASRLREDRRFASMLLVALTGWGADDDKRRSRAAGFDAHLTKPATQDSLSRALAAL